MAQHNEFHAIKYLNAYGDWVKTVAHNKTLAQCETIAKIKIRGVTSCAYYIITPITEEQFKELTKF